MTVMMLQKKGKNESERERVGHDEMKPKKKEAVTRIVE